MPNASFVTHVARTIYDLEPQSVEAIEPYCSDQRGIYLVRDTRDGVWMFRLLRSIYVSDSLLAAGHLLDWLKLHHYPAPRVHRTKDQQFVGIVDDWAITVLTYVEGSPLETQPGELAALAQIVGRLHALQVASPRTWAKSRNHPDTIATAAYQLATFRGNVPEAFRALVADLHAAMIALQRQTGARLHVTHGDCWSQNAIKTPEGAVVLIDWDQSGLGLPLLDLGNLLLSSHFDLNEPLHVKADERKIKAIVHGYQQMTSIDVQDSEHAANAMRFLLAWQLGSYIADETLIVHPHFPFVLQKLEARYNATHDIAEVVIGCLN